MPDNYDIICGRVAYEAVQLLLNRVIRAEIIPAHEIESMLDSLQDAERTSADADYQRVAGELSERVHGWLSQE